ncbi:alpha/beta fold hydrolase [Pseudoroseicyclus tamaricis]|uniref:Alpha/beta hydrolase n=1 Tax=Pseudoroseicyclus tamaricis TaxID=2705421 RepID=A0A6B2JV36_9RHOB|nr:alpha/beta hydrolase [Pseudoroseicyclus tamaricis]NDV01755.1 alpha/beta hydrolase [Pseudoroseicyclus tamaricis]
MPTFSAEDGTTIFYTDEGFGPPLLCLAGLTRGGEDFNHVAPHLQGLRLIRMDCRGRAGSAWANPATYTIPQEARDVLTLLAHLALPQVAVLGTSRGGLIAMVLAAAAKDRLRAVALNDVGPELMPEGLAHIASYLGRPPKAATLDEAAAQLATDPRFPGVSRQRWREEAGHRYREREDGLELRYDPALREAVLGESGSPAPAGDQWHLFEALSGLPLALIRGANSDLLSLEVADEMSRRRPDMIRAEVPDRGHVPFLDEPQALEALAAWRAAWT